MIINAFKNGIFPLQHEESKFEDEDDIRGESGLINFKNFYRLIF